MARLTGGQRALKAFVTEKTNRSQFTVNKIITPHQLLTKGETLARVKVCTRNPITGKKECKFVSATVTRK